MSKVLLLAHAIAAGVLIGASTHLAVQAVHVLRGKPRPRLLAIYPPVALVAWCCVVALGAVMYPRYRIDVRAAVLDVHAVWASKLFDVKENLAVVVGPLLAGAWWLSRGIADERDAVVRRWFAVACGSACAIAWCNALAGLLITSVRAV